MSLPSTGATMCVAPETDAEPPEPPLPAVEHPAATPAIPIASPA